MGTASEEGQAPPRSAPSTIFEPPALAAPDALLSPAEVEFFVEHGFLVKKRLLHADAVDAALESIWGHILDRVPMALESGWGCATNLW